MNIKFTIQHVFTNIFTWRMLMPTLIPEDKYLLLSDGRLHLQNLDINLSAVPKQYCIEKVDRKGKTLLNGGNLFILIAFCFWNGLYLRKSYYWSGDLSDSWHDRHGTFYGPEKLSCEENNLHFCNDSVMFGTNCYHISLLITARLIIWMN